MKKKWVFEKNFVPREKIKNSKELETSGQKQNLTFSTSCRWLVFLRLSFFF